MTSCRLFPMFSMRETLRIWQLSYCETNFERCERYKLSERGMTVPTNLLPNGTQLGRKTGITHG